MGDYLCAFMYIYTHMQWILCQLFVNGFLYVLLVCDGFFIHIVSFKIIFSVKRGYSYV